MSVEENTRPSSLLQILPILIILIPFFINIRILKQSELDDGVIGT